MLFADTLQLMLDSAVSDEAAKEFWMSNFTTSIKTSATHIDSFAVRKQLQIAVPWEDFLIALSKELKVSSRSLKDWIDIVKEKLPVKLSHAELPEHPTARELQEATSESLSRYLQHFGAEKRVEGEVQREVLRRTILQKLMCLKGLIGTDSINSSSPYCVSECG